MSFFNIYLSMTPQISVKNQDFAHFVKGDGGVFIVEPHGFCGINGGAAANGDDSLRTRFLHDLDVFKDSFDEMVGFDAFIDGNFHTCLLEVGFSFVQGAVPPAGTSAGTDDAHFPVKFLRISMEP